MSHPASGSQQLPDIPATVGSIRKNISSVQSRIDKACKRAGRDPADVRLLPVTKTVEPPRLRTAYEAGLRTFGENVVQEARRKAGTMEDLDIEWCMIGHLQTNKVKHVARFASEFQALDSLRVASALDRRLQAEGRSLDVFIQINSSGEISKYGIAPDAALPLARELAAFTSLRVQGLMTLAVFSGNERHVRNCFKRMRDLRERLRQDAPSGLSFDELSMGMSNDFELAIEEGATVVRVGQALFGQRPLPDSHYWPQTT